MTVGIQSLIFGFFDPRETLLIFAPAAASKMPRIRGLRLQSGTGLRSKRTSNKAITFEETGKGEHSNKEQKHLGY
jgi:hypothetical protein